MKRLVLPASSLVLLLAGAAQGPAYEHPCEASRILATYRPQRGEPTGAVRAAAARAFLKALDDEQRPRCSLALEDPERRTWTNVPPSPTDAGVRLGELAAEAVESALDLLAAVLSEQGYAQTRDILLADDRLLSDGQPRPGFGVESYRLVLFGEPSADVAWAMQLDGHHLAWNVTVSGDEVSLSPSFVGTQPAVYERDGERIEPLAREVDAGFDLVASLTPAQLEWARVAPQRAQLAAGAGRDGFVPEPTGLACGELDQAQRTLLLDLVDAYLGDLPEPSASRRRAAVRSEIDRMRFAWWGSTKKGSDISYRLQGPSLICELACQDLGGDPLDHLHSMLRDPADEYGARLLEVR